MVGKRIIPYTMVILLTLLLHAWQASLLGGRLNRAGMLGLPLPESQVLLGLVLLLVSLVLFILALRTPGVTSLAFLLASAGGVANALSRIYYGGVPDYYHVSFLPFMFNLPDVLLTIAGGMFILTLFSSRSEKREQHA